MVRDCLGKYAGPMISLVRRGYLTYFSNQGRRTLLANALYCTPNTLLFGQNSLVKYVVFLCYNIDVLKLLCKSDFCLKLTI